MRSDTSTVKNMSVVMSTHFNTRRSPGSRSNVERNISAVLSRIMAIMSQSTMLCHCRVCRLSSRARASSCFNFDAIQRRLRFVLPPVRMPNTALPILRSRPPRVVGMPVARLIFCFAAEIPMARFHEKLNPGIFIFYV